MINWSICWDFWNWVFSKFGVFVLKLYVQVNCWFIKYNWTNFIALEHASYVHSLHASYRLLFIEIFCALTLSDAVCPWFCFLSLVFIFVFPFQPLASWLGRLGPTRKPPPPLPQPSIVRGLDLKKTKKPMRSWIFLGLFRLRERWF